MDAIIVQHLSSRKRELDSLEQVIRGSQSKKQRVSEDIEALQDLQKDLEHQCSNDIQKAILMLEKKHFTLLQLMEKYPALAKDPAFWWSFLESKYKLPLWLFPDDLIFGAGEENETNAVSQDVDLVSELIKCDCSILYSDIPVAHPLKSNKKVVASFLEACPVDFECVPHNVQNDHPLLVAGALGRLPLHLGGLRDRILSRLSIDLWQNPAVMLSWAKAGGHWHEGIPDSFKKEKEIMALFARPQNCRVDIVAGKPPLSPLLLSDKHYMMKLLVDCPPLLFDLGPNFLGDMDHVVEAFSSPAGLTLAYGSVERLNVWRGELLDYLVKVAEVVRQKLQTHDAFVKLVLCSASIPSTNNPALFSLLEQSEETSLAIKKLIAAFAGVPLGPALGMLRRARKTLSLLGFSWSDLQCSATRLVENDE